MLRRLWQGCYLAILLYAPAIIGAPPEFIRYQGRLADDAGIPLTGDHDVVFAIYDAEIDGTLLWSSVTISLPLAEGIVDHLMGCGPDLLCGNGDDMPIPSSVFTGPEQWLQVSVDALPLAPRQRLASVPYALSADRLGDVVVVDHVAGTVTIEDGLIVSSGGLTVEGASPGIRLLGTGGDLPDFDGDSIVETGVLVRSLDSNRQSIRFRKTGTGVAGSGGIRWGRTNTNDFYLHRPDELGDDLVLEWVDYSQEPDGTLPVVRFEEGTGNVNFVGSISAPGGCTCTSDRRFKQEIETIPDALASVQRLRGVRFEWNDTFLSAHPGVSRSQIGVVAQEAEDVFPQLVRELDDGTKTVDYAKMSAVLIEAVKELSSEVDVLRARLEELETAGSR